MNHITRMLRSKTFWTGVSAVVGAGAGYASGDFEAGQAAQLAVTGAIGVFLRMAIAKGVVVSKDF
jgi:hypothetical protein